MILPSRDPFVRQEALLKVRIALSTSRYVRQRLLRILATTELFKTGLYDSLVDESALTCVPKGCRQANLLLCEDHCPHSRKVLRHCGKAGELIHTCVSLVRSWSGIV